MTEQKIYSVLAQLLGAIAGVVAAHLLFEQTALQISFKDRPGGAQIFPEAVATFGLMAAIFGTLRLRPASVPVAVGL
jgi:glycerol uptake facilitator-like aquaporin